MIVPGEALLLAMTALGASSGQATDGGIGRTALLATISATGALLTGLSYRVNRRASALDRATKATERFARAIELLDPARPLDVRLGAIYLLERVARESPLEHAPVVEILSAYVRSHPGTPDAHAAMIVLGRRESRHDGARLDLARADLSGMQLAAADLAGANLTGASLRDATLTRANLSRANLAGADLRGADLRRADLRRANLRGADLRQAWLSGARRS
jgi:hypothetical protein